MKILVRDSLVKTMVLKGLIQIKIPKSLIIIIILKIFVKNFILNKILVLQMILVLKMIIILLERETSVKLSSRETWCDDQTLGRD